MSERKVCLFIAMSLDGYIADDDGNIDWLSRVEAPGEDYGYADFMKTIDTVIMGRKTYDKVLSFGIPFPHSDKKCYVITRQLRPWQDNIVFYCGRLENLLDIIRQQQGQNIFIDGGAEVVYELMKQDLIDEYIISVIPIFLGSGLPLFRPLRPAMNLELVTCKSFEKGLVQVHYRRSG